MANDYEVGYGKPPKKYQFPKGQSGNRGGRPKKSKSIQNLIEEELDLLVPVKEGGREFRLTKRRAMVKRHVNAALNGNIRSLEFFVKYCGEHGIADPFQITIEDAEAFEAAVRRQTGSSDDVGGP